MANINECLDEIAQLKENWDNEGAEPVDPKLIEWTRKLWDELVSFGIKNVPQIGAVEDGSIDIIWIWHQHQCGIYCNIDLEDFGISVVKDCKVFNHVIEYKNLGNPLPEIVPKLVEIVKEKESFYGSLC
jgi:hypothetical protein